MRGPGGFPAPEGSAESSRIQDSEDLESSTGETPVIQYHSSAVGEGGEELSADRHRGAAEPGRTSEAEDL